MTDGILSHGKTGNPVISTNSLANSQDFSKFSEKRRKLTVGSLFAGIGGFDLGLERTGGFEVRWQVEIDEYCRRVLEKHWPNVKRYGDIRDVCASQLRTNDGRCAECGRREWVPWVHVLCGGFPCQNISDAGDCAGLDGEESRLWFEFLRFIRMVRPRYVLVENVAALLHRGMGRVIGDLAGIGYDAEWQTISAAAFGAEHIRERIFILAYPLRQRSPLRLNTGKDIEDARIFRKGLGFTFGAPHEGLECRGASRWSGNIHGIPSRVDRLKGLGNAVVPQIVTWIGQQILDWEAAHA